MPEKDGILYATDMTIFYQTFSKNPTGDWRYILGFEATPVRNEDFEVYCKVRWNFGDVKAYAPWLLKMKPGDRLVIRGGRTLPAQYPQLEWNYGVSPDCGSGDCRTTGNPVTLPLPCRRANRCLR